MKKIKFIRMGGFENRGSGAIGSVVEVGAVGCGGDANGPAQGLQRM